MLCLKKHNKDENSETENRNDNPKTYFYNKIHMKPKLTLAKPENGLQ